jgi:subtilisin family serine protease
LVIKYKKTGSQAIDLAAVPDAFGNVPKRDVMSISAINTNISRLNSFETTYQLRAIGKFDDLNLGILSYDVSNQNIDKLIARLKQDPAVEYVDKDYIYQLSYPNTNDSAINRTYHLQNSGQFYYQSDSGINGQLTTKSGADAKVSTVWDLSGNSEGQGVLVAVLDSGLAYNHPDLIPNLWDGSTGCKDANGSVIAGACPYHGYSFYLTANGTLKTDNNPAANKNIPYLDNNVSPDSLLETKSHGTHVAGIIAAAKNNSKGIAGVAPQAKIMGLQFDLSFSAMLPALDFATKNKVKIVNASFNRQGAESQAEKEALSRFTAAGGLLIAAAGNGYGNNNDQNKMYPCAYDLPGIICVAATDFNDELAGYSNYGANSVDVAAPGSYVYSSVINSYGDNGQNEAYAYFSGTSMATPVVSGVAALLWGYNPSLTAAQVKNAILSTADKLPALNGKVLSGGRVNAYNALKAVGAGTSDNGGSTLCGNRIIERGELCDDTNLGGQTCLSRGFDKGVLSCAKDCKTFITALCAKCGNGVVESGEVCDDGPKNGYTGYCNKTCSAKSSGGSAVCGNAIIETGETCDDGVKNGLPNFCNKTCTGKTATICGNGVVEGAEACDDGVNNGRVGYCNSTCSGRTSQGGTVTCTDSDGVNINIKGFVTGLNTAGKSYSQSDYCVNSNTEVWENFCINTAGGQINSGAYYKCSYGCVDGACYQAATKPDLTLEDIVIENNVLKVRFCNRGGEPIYSSGGQSVPQFFLKLSANGVMQDGVPTWPLSTPRAGECLWTAGLAVSSFNFRTGQSYSVVAEADWQAVLSESNESNNFLTKTVAMPAATGVNTAITTFRPLTQYSYLSGFSESDTLASLVNNRDSAKIQSLVHQIMLNRWQIAGLSGSNLNNSAYVPSTNEPIIQSCKWQYHWSTASVYVYSYKLNAKVSAANDPSYSDISAGEAAMVKAILDGACTGETDLSLVSTAPLSCFKPLSKYSYLSGFGSELVYDNVTNADIVSRVVSQLVANKQNISNLSTAEKNTYTVPVTSDRLIGDCKFALNASTNRCYVYDYFQKGKVPGGSELDCNDSTAQKNSLAQAIAQGYCCYRATESGMGK